VVETEVEEIPRRRTVTRTSWPPLIVGMLAVFIAFGAYCALADSSDDGTLPLSSQGQDSGTGQAGAGVQPTTPAQQQGAPSAAQAVLLSVDQLRSLAIKREEFAAFFGSCAFEIRTENGTDPAVAVSSSPQLVQSIRAANPRAVYNAAAATVPCSTLAVQSLVGSADAATVQALYREFEQVYPTLFTNVRALGAVSTAWEESYCQDGVFASNNTRWLVCFMRRATYLGTIIVAFPPQASVPAGQSINPEATLTRMRAFADRIAASLAALYTAGASPTTTVPSAPTSPTTTTPAGPTPAR
jgi:hypothetical protein